MDHCLALASTKDITTSESNFCQEQKATLSEALDLPTISSTSCAKEDCKQTFDSLQSQCVHASNYCLLVSPSVYADDHQSKCVPAKSYQTQCQVKHGEEVVKKLGSGWKIHTSCDAAAFLSQLQEMKFSSLYHCAEGLGIDTNALNDALEEECAEDRKTALIKLIVDLEEAELQASYVQAERSSKSVKFDMSKNTVHEIPSRSCWEYIDHQAGLYRQTTGAFDAGSSDDDRDASKALEVLEAELQKAKEKDDLDECIRINDEIKKLKDHQ